MECVEEMEVHDEGRERGEMVRERWVMMKNTYRCWRSTRLEIELEYISL